MRTCARIVAMAVLLTTAASAQQKPNFSGRWVIVSPAEGAGREQIVTQDDKTLSVEQVSATGGRKMTYPLDGIERRQAIASRGADITIMSRAAWDGDRIVITTNTVYPGMKTQAKDVWSLDAQGRLVIDSSETGPTGPGPGFKIIFIKKP